jgi:hypothetical protein
MYFVYVDESGDTGEVAGGGSATYALGIVMVDDEHWAAAFDQFLAFRRNLRDRYDIRVRSEIKANYLIRGSGSLLRLGLQPYERRLIYRGHLHQLSSSGCRTFSIVVDKRSKNLHGAELRTLAWETLLQRLERTTAPGGSLGPSKFAIIHDEGEDDHIRLLVRRSRRWLTAGSAFGTGARTFKIDQLVDDPSPRRSHENLFLQCADLVAYAAFRSVVPPPARIDSVCPATMWNQLGSATLTQVNQVRPRAAPGIVLRD